MNNHLTPSVPTLATVRASVVAAYSLPAGIDLAAVAPLLSNDVVLHVPGTQPLSGDHRGLGAVAEFVLASRDATSDGEHIELLDVMVGDAHVGVAVRVTAERPDGRQLVNDTIHLMRFDDNGLVAEIWFHNRDQAVVDAFWS